jgi:hypothetical protein
MTRRPAAPVMTDLVAAIHPDAPNAAVGVVVRLRAGGLKKVTGGVRIEVLEAARIAMTSAAGRCSRRRSRGCQSRPSPMT